jgi:protein-tyrosine phosphatase
MIDVHSHILPNIDDGSRSIEETFNLIKEAKEAGFEGIVCTSHYMENYYETNRPEREVWINAIHENLENKNIDMNLYLGNEIYMSDNIIELLEDGKATTMNDTSYVLFELPMNAEPINLYDMVYEMQQYKIVPILAHPERYSFVQTDPELIYDLIDKGVLMQANYGSIIGQYGKKAQMIVQKFLENNMIHMLGTDVHRQNTIYPKIPEIILELKSLIGEEKVKELTTINPELVINNKRIDIRKPYKVELTLKEKISMYTEDTLQKVKTMIRKSQSGRH